MNRPFVVLLLIATALSAVAGLLVEELSVPLWVTAAATAATAVVGLLLKKPVERFQDRTDPGRFTQHLVKGGAVRVRDTARDVPGLLGVHPARFRDPDDVHSDQLPDYVQRPELEKKVRDRLKAHGLVVVTGGSATGKSRLAYQVVRELYPDRMLYRPLPGEAGVRGLVATGALPRKAVFWLDGVEDHVAQGLRPEDIAGLLPEGHGNAVVATMRVHPGSGSGDDRSGQSQETFLRRFAGHEVQVPRGNDGYSEDVPDDPRIREAAAQSRHGLTEYLAQGPAAYLKWERLSGNADTHRAGAVVEAAVDARRAGRHTPLPKELLRRLHEHYVDTSEGSGAGRQTFDEALNDAARPYDGASGCLMESDQVPGAYYAFDYLVDRAQENEEPVATPVLEELVEATEGPELVSLGRAAQESDRGCALRAADRRLAERPGDAAALGLRGAVLLEKAHGRGAEDEWHGLRGACSDLKWNDDTPEAVGLVRRAVEAGDERSRPVLGTFLQRSGRFEEALEHLRQVEEPDGVLELRIAKALRGLGRLDEADEQLMKVADRGLIAAFFHLAVNAADRGNLDLSLYTYDWLADAARELDDRRLELLTMHARAELLFRVGLVAEAVEFSEKGAEKEEAWAFYALVRHFEDTENMAMASLWSRRAADAGILWAMAKQGMITDDEIQQSRDHWYARTHAAADLYSEMHVRLAVARTVIRAMDRVIEWADRGTPGADLSDAPEVVVGSLDDMDGSKDTGATDAPVETATDPETRIALHREQGNHRELVSLLAAEVAAGRENRVEALDEALDSLDREDWMPVITEAADTEHRYPTAVVLTMLRAGFEQRAEELLLLYVHTGDQRALKLLATFYKERERHGELVELLRHRVYLGSSSAAAELAEYLYANTEVGSVEEDLTWPLASFARSEGEMSVSTLMAVYVLGGDKRRLVAETIEAGGAGHARLAVALVDDGQVEEAEAVFVQGEDHESFVYRPPAYLDFAEALVAKGLGSRAEAVLERMTEDGATEKHRARAEQIRARAGMGRLRWKLWGRRRWNR
ncbi:hypothetical protein IDM40_07460 [Nocardiopsis sp. HNM0947]|uniref:Tetratricopeptide repeat protein n=1 Tax=Nocardiopsis coralli TaxID=2772213 RepID=A0ABR9P3W8_9ACTN|nr:hypothetical protein [Nocardiopsis coralli]MBE2998538.1 hypothetical protein [Nocardiopsis coralli]